MTVKKQSFGDRLRAERIRLGLNQSDFAALAGIKRTAQHFYETGARVPDLRYLERIQQAGADIEYLMGTGSGLVRAGGLTTTARAADHEPASTARQSRSKEPSSSKAPGPASHQSAASGDALQQLVSGIRKRSAEATKRHEVQSEEMSAVFEALGSGDQLILSAPGTGKTFKLVESIGQEAIRNYGPSVRVLVLVPNSTPSTSPATGRSSTKKAATPKKSAVKRHTPS